MSPKEEKEEEAVIPEGVVAQMVRMLGKVAAMNDDLPVKKQRLMEGLRGLVDADGWLWTATRVLAGESRPVSVGVMHSGLTEKEFAGWVDASQIGRPGPPEDPPLVELFSKGRHFTRTRQQLVSDEEWYAHPTVKRYRINRGLDHFLYTVFPLDKTLCSAIGFFRRVGREPFTALERRICHVVTANIEWMHLASFPEHEGSAVPGLTPRQRTILVYLLDGKTKTDICRLLHLSEPTVGEHISRVYRHFGVSSQVALMRHFQLGNRADVG